jgi:RecA-family ATPase
MYNREYQVVDRGSLFYVGGPRGSFKSTLGRAILSACMSGKTISGYKYEANGKKIVYIDTEMPVHLFRRGQEDMLALTGQDFPENYEAYRLSHIPDPVEKRKQVESFIEENKGLIDVVLIDGIGDLVTDMGNTTEVTNLMHKLVALAEETDCLVICLSHTNDFGALLDKLGRHLERKARAGVVLHKAGGWVLHIPSKDTYEPLPESEFFVNEQRMLVPGEYIPFPVHKAVKIY